MIRIKIRKIGIQYWKQYTNVKKKTLLKKNGQT